MVAVKITALMNEVKWEEWNFLNNFRKEADKLFTWVVSYIY